MSRMENNAQQIADLASQSRSSSNRHRVLIAVAGAPGSGKSTLAERAVDLLNERDGLQAALFTMDGFHYDDQVLKALGRLASKGAIDTFDAYGLRHMLQRLKTNEDDTVAVPVFDRSLEISRAGGRLIPRSVEIIICEGNYLLATQSPWNQLKSLFDATVFVEVEEGELRRRLRNRWLDQGLEEAEINRRVEENDMPNGTLVMSCLSEPDLRLSNS